MAIALHASISTARALMYVYPKACKVAVIEPDRASSEVEADLVVSLIEKELPMSDAARARGGHSEP